MPDLKKQQGALMLEVLITIVIMLIGIYGIMSVQARLQISEFESYQRTQAVLLVSDMTSRISTNRNNAASYTADYLGVGMVCPTAVTNRQQIDQREWCLSLQGAAETEGSSNLGAMVGARGCIEDLGANQYMVSVTWQGQTPFIPPPTSVSCAQNLYDQAGSECVGDACRRYLTSIVKIANL